MSGRKGIVCFLLVMAGLVTFSFMQSPRPGIVRLPQVEAQDTPPGAQPEAIEGKEADPGIDLLARIVAAIIVILMGIMVVAFVLGIFTR